MTIILTNDDGIDAPGIRVLQQVVNSRGNSESIIVAPQEHQSGCGHQVNTNKPIHVERRSDQEYAVASTPADCTRLAVSHLCQDATYVISGINAGGNLGVDSYISGTIAAVREGVIHGIPGIAISHYIKKPLVIDWELAGRWTVTVLDNLFSRPLPPGTFWNVNFPHLEPGAPDPELVFCQPSKSPLPINYRVEGNKYYYQGEYQKRDRTPGTDVDICFSGKIAITQLRL
ncbi:MAG: 5'/3'-nucleotidase SurE [Symploca sp. SIO2E6]|nr:5'/3'-nucleotidase SurE [Symploca sp. SIO2E6]